MGRENNTLIAVMACNSLFITCSLRLLISSISSRVKSRDSMKDKSSSDFFFPNWFRDVVLSLGVEEEEANAARDWMDEVVNASVVEPHRAATKIQMARITDERELRKIIVE